MTSIKGTRTEKNLLTAFAGESQARNRYTMAAKKAASEGFMQIEAIFLETADNERVHAENFFKFLEGGMVEITASYPSGIIGTTTENLEAAARGEHEEWETLYPQAAEIAEKEGFNKVASQFRLIAKVEKEHEARYLKLLDNLKAGKVFKKDGNVIWLCRDCGYIHIAKEPPKICPVCMAPQSYFEIKKENY